MRHLFKNASVMLEDGFKKTDLLVDNGIVVYTEDEVDNL